MTTEYELTVDWGAPIGADLDGYRVADYFLDGGSCLHRTYATPGAALRAWCVNYLGRDCCGVGLRYEITEAEVEP